MGTDRWIVCRVKECIIHGHYLELSSRQLVTPLELLAVWANSFPRREALRPPLYTFNQLIRCANPATAVLRIKTSKKKWEIDLEDGFLNRSLKYHREFSLCQLQLF